MWHKNLTNTPEYFIRGKDIKGIIFPNLTLLRKVLFLHGTLLQITFPLNLHTANNLSSFPRSSPECNIVRFCSLTPVYPYGCFGLDEIWFPYENFAIFGQEKCLLGQDLMSTKCVTDLLFCLSSEIRRTPNICLHQSVALLKSYSRFICFKIICIEKVKLLDQCQGRAKKKRRQWDVSKGWDCALRGDRRV
jgi:hypothetical protein